MRRPCEIADELARVLECILVGVVAVLGAATAVYVYIRAFEVVFAFARAATSLP